MTVIDIQTDTCVSNRQPYLFLLEDDGTLKVVKATWFQVETLIKQNNITASVLSRLLQFGMQCQCCKMHPPL